MQVRCAVRVGEQLLPAGARVQLNLYSLHRTSRHWSQPELFRPERFLSAGRLERDPWLQPFSTGRRRCIGENLAASTTFLLFTAILQATCCG